MTAWEATNASGLGNELYKDRRNSGLLSVVEQGVLSHISKGHQHISIEGLGNA